LLAFTLVYQLSVYLPFDQCLKLITRLRQTRPDLGYGDRPPEEPDYGYGDEPATEADYGYGDALPYN
jgi:hypothetical protein